MPLPGLFGRFTGGLFGNALGYGVGSALGPILAPPVQDIGNELWLAHPVRPLDASIAAQVAIKNPGLAAEMQREAQMTGFSDARFGFLRDAIDVPPGIGELIELFRRKRISIDELNAGLRSSMLERAWIPRMENLARIYLSPPELAAMRQQQFISADEHRTRAELQGVDAADADLQFEIAGLPPGIAEGLELVRRGKIDHARFAQMVAEGHTKTKYTDDLLELRTVPLSASVAAEALVRERVSQARAREIAAHNGLTTEDFDLYANMLGRPIAPGEAVTAVNRELVGAVGSPESRAFFREVIARSDVRTQYADLLYELRQRFPSLFELRRLIQEGAISDDLAREIVVKEGYSAKIAQGVVDAAHSQKTKATKDLSQQMIVDLYEGGFEPQDWAASALVGLGYDPDEAQLLLELVDARRVLTALRSQLNVIHSRYIGHKVDRTRAMEELDNFGIGDTARGLLLESWDAEREANVTRLTNAQIGSALKHAIITEPDAVARWVNNGYPADDAAILAKLATVAPHGASPTAT